MSDTEARQIAERVADATYPNNIPVKTLHQLARAYLALEARCAPSLISTAPKDGTRILAHFPNFGWCTASFHSHTRPDGTLAYAYWANDPDNSREESFFSGYEGQEPTHWMPLPDALTDNGGQG